MGMSGYKPMHAHKSWFVNLFHTLRNMYRMSVIRREYPDNVL